MRIDDNVQLYAHFDKLLLLNMSYKLVMSNKCHLKGLKVIDLYFYTM